MKPLVSILIPAYNASRTIGKTIESALAQSWPRKEIIVVDDGSSDRTAEVVSQYASRGVLLIEKANGGAASTRNRAFRESRGDYIQWLDADDLLGSRKIELQLEALYDGVSSPTRTLASGPWAHFRTRPSKAHFVPNSLWNDLPPAEWLRLKMGEILHMQTATWLTSRELSEMAGEWDTSMLSDDDGEYFCRVLLESEGTRFVPEAKVYYRNSPASRLSFVGTSDRKLEAMVRSNRLHVQYLLSLEDSERTREACLKYLHTWSHYAHPDRPDLVEELGKIARDLGEELRPPELRWKYRWMVPVVGERVAKRLQNTLPELKARCLYRWDDFLGRFDNPGGWE